MKKAETKSMQLVKNTVLLSVFFVLNLCLKPTLQAAQLVDTIPATLTHNWQMCLHYETKAAQCQTTRLPEKNYTIESSVKSQTYTKDFIPSSELKNYPLGIFVDLIEDVDKISVNGKTVGRTGQFPPGFESGFRQQRLYLIPTELLQYNQFNRIEIQTYSSRFRPGILSNPPILGNYFEMQKKVQQRNYVYLTVATILLVLLIFPIFYFLAVKGNYETVYFMFFLFSFSIVSLARSQMPIELGMDLSTAFKLESIMLTVASISFSLYVFSFFDLELRKYYVAGLYLLGLSGVVLIIWPYSLYLRKIAEFNYWLVNFNCFFVTGSALIIAIHKQRKYSLIFSVTATFGWLILLYDTFMQSSGSFDFYLTLHPTLVPVTSAFVSMIFTLTLTHKYWHFFKGSTYDHLTGTLLRPAFFQRLAEEMQRCRRSDEQLLIAVIEIQQAKRISMNYGYSIGNHLLSAVSQSLTKELRPYDLICRFSDEQFCISASINSIESAELCIQRIYNQLINIQQPINQEVELYIDARIGSVIFNENQHLSVSHIIQDANYALAKAKSESKQRYLLVQNPIAVS